jgi:uncharacterized protein (TIGR02147 family)
MREDIFTYKSYRDFLKKFIEIQKATNKKYSYSYYSQLIGSSEPYLKQVLAGRRKLTLDNAKVLSKKLRLGELESSYFLTLVMADNAKTDELKSYFNDILERMKELRPLNYEDRDKFRTVFHDTKMWEIYTLLGLRDSSIDYEWIKSKLKGASELSTIKKYISQLKNHHLIEVAKSEVKTNNVIVEHGEDLLGVYVNSLKRAIEYLIEPSQREKQEHFDAFCMIVSDEDYLKIQKVLEETKSKIAQISMTSKTKDRIAFFNSNFFFVSK